MQNPTSHRRAKNRISREMHSNSSSHPSRTKYNYFFSVDVEMLAFGGCCMCAFAKRKKISCGSLPLDFCLCFSFHSKLGASVRSVLILLASIHVYVLTQRAYVWLQSRSLLNEFQKIVMKALASSRKHEQIKNRTETRRRVVAKCEQNVCFKSIGV